ncbi:Vacuolar amino acid transporter 6 [Pichia kudriavzevii]|uniref:Vacuolar amino acid transporter 6 n=1 Tax=Pichia kudriavzevii TaxID=4909 RepID=A0A1V2LPS1_PICKU|nr:Vacuolar amino acid transporter 6 [Pichia kudriavzevii]
MTIQHYEGASIASSVINTVNTVIGAGILVLPYAFRTQSIIGGTFIIIFAGIANGVGMVLQGAASKFLPQGTATFFTVCRITYPGLSLLFDFAIFLQCFGVGVSYIVLTGDLLPLVYTFDGWDEHSMKFFYVLGSAFLVVPLCYMKKIDSLKYASIIALLAIVYIAFLIYGYFFYAIFTNYEKIPPEKLGGISFFKPEGIKPVFKTLGVVVLAYTCPTQFSIVGELANPSMERITNIVFISLGIISSIFVSVGLAGYLTFGNTLSGNILLMYENNFYTQTGRALLVLMVVLSFPLMFHPARVSFNNVCHIVTKSVVSWGTGNDVAVNSRSPLLPSNEEEHHVHLLELVEEEDVPMSNTRFFILTVLLLAASYTTALSLKSFELILAVVGATGGVLISFVLPGFYGYKLIASDDERYTRRLYKYSPNEAQNRIFQSKLLKNVSLFLIVWGLVVMMICLWAIFFT